MDKFHSEKRFDYRNKIAHTPLSLIINVWQLITEYLLVRSQVFPEPKYFWDDSNNSNDKEKRHDRNTPALGRGK
jgi:hypothetical protein